MKKLLSKFKMVVPVLMCVFAFTALMLTGCKDEQPHVHKLELISEKVATCTETGEREHYHCTLCDKNYLTEKAETEVSAEDLEIAVNPDNHNYNYVYDYTNSRYVAKCTRCDHTDSTKTQTAGVEGYPYLVNNENTLLSAVENGGYIKLADNITINGVIIISKKVNIDLNEKTISYTQTQADNNGGSSTAQEEVRLFQMEI